MDTPHDNDSSMVTDYSAVSVDISEPSRERTGHGTAWAAMSNQVKVTVTVLRMGVEPPSAELRDRELALCRAACLWRTLKHPNIVEFLGISDKGPYHLALVWLWVEDENVLSYLAKNPGASREALVQDIAEGLLYLHSHEPPIVHGALRAENVLVRSSGRACLSGYGLASVPLGQDSEVARNEHIRWLPPERMAPGDYGFESVAACQTPASDIYSFGMVVYEIFTEQVPFFEVVNIFHLPAMVRKGQRPTKPGDAASMRGFSEDLWLLVQECWHADLKGRPDAKELVNRLLHPAAAGGAESAPETTSAGTANDVSSVLSVQSTSSVSGDGASPIPGIWERLSQFIMTWFGYA